ncbi:MAG: hypothetical protein HKP30_00025 [Myxococcales bacterium]|nr:hypothetical protein [Myxococcales bacterium]
MRRILGSLALGLLLAAAPPALADDPEAEPRETIEAEGSNGKVILGAVAVLLAVGGAVAFFRSQ